jgi:hypothetical protein
MRANAWLNCPAKRERSRLINEPIESTSRTIAAKSTG